MGKHRPWLEIKKDLEALINEMNREEVTMSFEIVMKRTDAYRKKENRELIKKKGFKEGGLVRFSVAGPPGSERLELTGVIEEIIWDRGELKVEGSNGETHQISARTTSRIPASH